MYYTNKHIVYIDVYHTCFNNSVSVICGLHVTLYVFPGIKFTDTVYTTKRNIYIYIYIYIYTYMHTYIHTFVRTFVRTYIHTYKHNIT